MFEVERKDDRFTVTPYKIDGRTGKLTGDGDSYWASYDSNYDSPSDMYLEIQTCWYKYENIREGFICHFYRIPSVIKGATVLGFNDYSFTISSTPSDTFQVSVTSKSTRESTCDVKAETYEGQKVYYPKSSTYYEDTTRDFRCFDSEDQAKKAGYKASVR